jgi:5'-nucleotidase
MAVAFPTRRRYQDKLVSFDAPDGYTYCFINSGFIESENDPGSDWEVVSRNLASVSPVYLYPVVPGDRCAVVPPYKAATACPEKNGVPIG